MNASSSQPPTLKTALAIAATSLALNLIPDSAFAAFHVMIDPGHGGVDTGAVRGHLKEADIALKVSHHLVDILSKDPSFKVSLTRSTDTKVSLARRVQLAHESGAELFLSVHLNSSPDARAQGKEFYFQNQLPADEEALLMASRENEEVGESEGEELIGSSKADSLSARSDVKRILQDLQRNHKIVASSDLSKSLLEAWTVKGNTVNRRPIRQAPFHVVAKTEIPAVLVELGFLTHPTEGPRLNTSAYQKELAKSLYAGLVKYKERVDKENGATLKSQP